MVAVRIRPPRDARCRAYREHLRDRVDKRHVLTVDKIGLWKSIRRPRVRKAAARKQRTRASITMFPFFIRAISRTRPGCFGFYDRQRGTYKELHPRVICFEKDLYAVKPENKPRDVQVESKVLGVVDILGSRGIRDFQIGRPNSEAEQEIAFFMAFQWNRVPTISRDIRTTYAKAIEELSRITFANVER